MDYDIIFNISSVLFIISIICLFIFCAIIPKMNVARWFYLLFAITIPPLLPKLMEDIEEKWLIIWPLLFTFAGLYMFVGLTLSLKDIKGTPKEEELNKKLQEISLKGGKRRIAKNISKNK